MTELDAAIEAAIHGYAPTERGVGDFAGSPSAVRKAEGVIDAAQKSGLNLPTAAVISLGGADGTEIEYILKHTPISKGILIEFDDALAQSAINKARMLVDDNKELKVYTGDVTQKLPVAIKALSEWLRASVVDSLVVTIHALLHELPHRGGKTCDIEALLSRFHEADMPGIVVIREPCAPRDLPETVYLHADCQPRNLVELADAIRKAHPEIFHEDRPTLMHDKVRMSSRLAAETIVKLFYLDSFAYELDEVVTSFTRDDLVDRVRNVFGTDNVRHTDFQSDSFEKFWSLYGLRLTDYENRELRRPQLHVGLVAKLIKGGSAGRSDKSGLQVSGTAGTGKEIQQPVRPPIQAAPGPTTSPISVNWRNNGRFAMVRLCKQHPQVEAVRKALVSHLGHDAQGLWQIPRQKYVEKIAPAIEGICGKGGCPPPPQTPERPNKHG